MPSQVQRAQCEAFKLLLLSEQLYKNLKTVHLKWDNTEKKEANQLVLAFVFDKLLKRLIDYDWWLSFW